MLERISAPAGTIIERTFTTNVRTPDLPKLPLNATGREEVSLDQFDRGNERDWDQKLTIKWIGPHTCLRSLAISPAPDVPTVFLAGDSTVTDRDGGQDVSWGQLLPRFFKPGIAISNQAQSGETLKSFANALRLDKIFSQMKKGDYLFIQFGHNDSKESWPQTYVAPDSTYKAYLRVYIAEARLRGAVPVLVTPMDRGNRTTGAPTHGLGLYPQAMREVAKEQDVPLIDLNAMSDVFYDSAGADAPKILADGTHSTAYGGYEFAKCVVTGIKQEKLPLEKFIVDDFRDFDPSHPDSREALQLDGLFDPSGVPFGSGSAAGKKSSAGPGPGPL
jgi:lysophospholipase L1-like esterase